MKEGREGSGRKEGARRLGKPGGAAQPGEASPVSVASPCLIRCRGAEPHERRPREGRSVSGHTLEQDRSPREDPGEEVSFLTRPGNGERPWRPAVHEAAKAMKGSSTNEAIPRSPARLWRTGQLHEGRGVAW